MRTAPGTEPVELLDLGIEFLSFVGSPAHKKAQIVLRKAAKMKRKPKKGDPDYKAAKAVLDEMLELAKGDPDADEWTAAIRKDDTPVVMTSNEEGHAHLVWIHDRAGLTSYQTSEGSDNGHDHPWMLSIDGDGSISLVIGESDGHTHEVEQASLNGAFAVLAIGKLDDSTEEAPMPAPKKTQKTTEDVNQDVTALQERLALSQLYGGFNDATREYFDTLDESGKVAFVGKSQESRGKAVKKFQAEREDENAVVYTDREGIEYTKSSDPTTLRLAKRADALEKRLEERDSELSTTRLEKRAKEEFPNLPGALQMLKAIEKIEDEDERKAALKGLKSANAAASGAFRELGSEEADEMDDDALEADQSSGAAMIKLDRKVKKFHAENPTMTEAQAYAEVLKTDEGRALYGRAN